MRSSSRQRPMSAASGMPPPGRWRCPPAAQPSRASTSLQYRRNPNHPVLDIAVIKQKQSPAMSLITTTLGKIAAPERRTMAVACGAHVLHDGYTDLLYVLLPLWQAEFGLGYAEVGLLRALYVGAMAGFQVPAGALADRFGGPLVLALGTVLAGTGYLLAGASAGFAMLLVALIVGGLGSGVQHPISATLVSQAFPGIRSRQALAGYNFSGDLGKMAFPAATAWLLTLM